MKLIFSVVLALLLCLQVSGQFQVKSDDPAQGYLLWNKTLSINSANILAGDSLLIIEGETGVKIIPVFISVKYTDGVTYTHTDTDTTWIYTYSNSLPVKVVGISDSFIEGTFDNQSSIAIDEQSGDAEAPYWINLKNFNAGTGTLTLDFYYLKK